MLMGDTSYWKQVLSFNPDKDAIFSKTTKHLQVILQIYAELDDYNWTLPSQKTKNINISFIYDA